MFKYFMILCIFCNASFSAFELHDDFSAFEGKPVVALWRGTYFSPTHFPTDQDQRDYMASHGLQVPIYCAASHREANITYTQPLSTKRRSVLNQSSERIQKTFKEMAISPPITIDRKQFSNRRHAFQQIYSNSTDFIAALGQEVISPTYRKYKPLLQGLPKGNPLLSFTTEVGHAAHYGYGLKDYGHIDALHSLYDENGHRQHTHVGYLQGIFLTNDIAKQTLPYDVVAHHGAGHIKISTHFSNNILSEKEVSVVGKMGGSAVVIKLPLEIPDLSGPYPGEYREKFGLTKRKYDNIHAVVTDPQTPLAQKQARVSRMLKELITPQKEDNGLVYKHTLYHKAQDVLESIFDGFDDFREGALGLDGRVYDADLHA